MNRCLFLCNSSVWKTWGRKGTNNIGGFFHLLINIFLFLGVIFLLRYSHTSVIFTHVTYTIQWFLVYSQSSATITTVHVRTFSSIIPERSPAFTGSYFPNGVTPPPTTVTIVLFASSHLLILDVSCLWSQAVYGLLCLASFTSPTVF